MRGVHGTYAGTEKTVEPMSRLSADASLDNTESFLISRGWTEEEVAHAWCWRAPGRGGCLYRLKDAVELEKSKKGGKTE